MAPEQAASTHDADARSDIYSLGCTLFRLLTGESIYQGETAVQKILAHVGDPIPSLVQRRMGVPPELDAIFQKMVAKSATDRFQTMLEVEQALTKCLTTIQRVGNEATITHNAVGWTPRPSVKQTGANGRGFFGRRPPPVKWLAAAAAAFLLISLGVWVIIRDKNGKELSRTKVPDGGTLTVENGEPEASAPGPGTKTTKPKTGIKRPGANASGSPVPEMAKAPFDAATAKKHQAAWAKHLGMEVETPNSVGAMMILIPPGEFLMGSTDEQVEAALKVANEINADANTLSRIEKAERPQHRVVISQPFLFGATEVTIGQFKKFSATGYVTEAEKAEAAAKATPPVDPNQPPPKPIQTYLSPGYVVTDDSPAAVITWNDAVAYCDWLSKQEKITYRLPTEAEWEYACRAGTTTQYSFGDDHTQLGNHAWFNQNAGGRSHPVGTKLPNPFGLFDMHGNLYEWCGDFWDEKWYEKSAVNDPTGPSAGSSRVIRGGDWYHSSSFCRSAYRYFYTPSLHSSSLGFRVVCSW